MSITMKTNMDKKEIEAVTIKKGGRLTAIASTEDKDRGGDVILVKNWDFTKFEKNPVLQAGHDYRPQYTIGRAENLRVEGTKVLFDPVFHEITPLAKQVKEMYEQGFLKAWSVGFIPGTKQIEDKTEGTNNELLEVSAVAVPANAHALMKGFESDTSIEKDIDAWLHEDVAEAIGDAVVEKLKENVEEKALVEVSTGETNDHVHLASYDDVSGNGTTDEVNDHVHAIEDFVVQETDDHTHSLTTPELDAEENSAHKKPKKKKEFTENWNKQLPEIFNKDFDVDSIEGVKMSFENEVFTKFFDCEVKNLYINTYAVPSALIGTYLSAFKAVSDDFELVDTRNWSGRYEAPPQYEVIQLNSTKSDDFLVQGMNFYKVKGKNHVALQFQPGWGCLYVSVVTGDVERSWNKELLAKAHVWAKENNYLKGEHFALSGEFIPSTDKTWDDVILDKSVKKSAQYAVEKVADADAKSRGLLMVGPPGTGKTLTGKIMLNSSESTFIWVSAKDMYRIGATWALKIAFELARDLGPTILFMEDIDSWLYDGATDLLKTEMDGIQENKGLITVLTSNYPEKLPDALLDRPGRFHEILNFSLPDKGVRKQMITTWIGEEVDEKVLENLLEETEGLSGAYMKELVDYAKIIAEDEELSLTDALVKSLQKIKEQKELIRQIRQSTKSFDIISIKEGKIISKATRKKLEIAKDAINDVLAIEERRQDIDEEEDKDVKGMSQFVPTKKVKTAVKAKELPTDKQILLKTLQKVASVANEGLREGKK